MKYIYKIITYSFLAIGCLFLNNCQDDFLEQDIRSISGPDVIYSDLEGLEAGLNGIYATVRYQRGGIGDGGSNDPRIDPMMTGTDILYVNRERDRTRFLNDWGSELLSNDARSQIDQIWQWLYEVIASTNQIISRAGVLSENELSEDDRNRVIAEARMMRAWAYRHLTYMFGDVPLNIEEITSPRLDWERDPVEVIYDQMQNDLEFAAAHLPEEHINDGKVIKAVAQHYLAELLIIREDFIGAIAAAQGAIDGPRALITERFGAAADQPGTVFSDIFQVGNANPSDGNTEVLWVFQNDLLLRDLGGNGGNIMRRWFGSEYGTASGNGLNLAITVERGGRGLNLSSATKFALDLYRDENGNVIDERGDGNIWRTYFVIIQEDLDNNGGVYSYNGVSYGVGDTLFLDVQSVEQEQDRTRPYTRKWDWTHEGNLTESRNFDDLIHLRLADTYLLLAEAQLKNGDASSAAETINVLRRRANAPEITAEDVDIDYILDERARELFTEEERRYTLLRTNKWVERTNLHNTIASGQIDPSRDVLYPIPQSFIDSNLEVEIKNNPGY